MAQSHVSIAAAGKRRRRSARRLMRRVRRARPVSCLILTLIAVIMLIPIVFTFLYSFFPKSEISSYLAQRGSYDQSRWMDILFSPAQVSLRQYYTILIEEPQYLQLFCNSVLYAGAILVGQAFVIPLTAYALSRFQFRGRDALFFLVLVLMVLPFQVTMAPSVMTLRALGLLDTFLTPILPNVMSAYNMFILRNYFQQLPESLEESAYNDGANPFIVLFRIILPIWAPSWQPWPCSTASPTGIHILIAFCTPTPMSCRCCKSICATCWPPQARWIPSPAWPGRMQTG